MTRQFGIVLSNEAQILDFEKLPEAIQKAARIAVNRAAEQARTLSAREVRKQVNFPASYVSPSGGRLEVKSRATDSSLTAVVSARSRATSLARFARGRSRGKTGGVTVEVKPGRARFMRGAFFIRLRSGKADLDTAFNQGLAIRTKGGVRPDRAYRPIQLKNGLWLLYGPSVAQALLSAKGTGIWPKLEEQIQDLAGAEFARVLRL